MFSFNQLNGFVAVAEELHFGRAAQRLHMTQPPLTRQIQQLEKQLGVRLFDRSGRTARLTPAGRTFLRDARRLLHETENAALAARRAGEGRTGVVRIGFTATSAYGVLGGLLAALRERLPHVDVVLHEHVTRDQAELLSAGSLDLGLVRPFPERPDLESRCFRRESLVAALPDGHPLAAEKALSPEDFHGLHVVSYSSIEARYFYELVVGTFRPANVRPTYVQHVSQVHTVLALVQAGLGVALVPATAAHLHFAGIEFRAVALSNPEPVELHLMWRNGNDNPALAALLDVV